MGTQQESYLQRDIQNLIEARGGYGKKNHGNMITEPGTSDLWFCYHGLFLVIEAKVNGNKPTRAQGIHLRNAKKAGAITLVAWSTKDVELVLNMIDKYYDRLVDLNETWEYWTQFFEGFEGVDDGSTY